jgi:hypothetical protein
MLCRQARARPVGGAAGRHASSSTISAPASPARCSVEATLALIGFALYPRGGPGDTIEWGGRIAAGVMVIVPSLTFFLIASGRIARGLVSGAVKG